MNIKIIICFSQYIYKYTKPIATPHVWTLHVWTLHVVTQVSVIFSILGMLTIEFDIKIMYHLGWKTRSFNFAMFYGYQTYWDLTCFSIAHFYKKYLSDHNQTWKSNWHRSVPHYFQTNCTIMRENEIIIVCYVFSPLLHTTLVHIVTWEADWGSGCLKMTVVTWFKAVITLDSGAVLIDRWDQSVFY